MRNAQEEATQAALTARDFWDAMNSILYGAYVNRDNL